MLEPQFPSPRSSLPEQVADELRDAIVSMRLQPGQRLVERELVEWSGVARTTIREALRQLAAEGLVAVIPRRGAVVAMPTPQEAEEIYQIRALLEGLVGFEFVEKANPDQRARLHQAYEVMLAEAGSPSPTLLAAKNSFYEVLLEGASNSTARSVLAGLHARVSALRATTMAQPGRAEQAIREIGRIVDAVEANDADAAREACAAHVESARRTAITVIPSMNARPTLEMRISQR